VFLGRSLRTLVAGLLVLPRATGSPHTWDYAKIGTITFPQVGRQLLTFHYNNGDNFAFFEFERVEAKGQ